PALPLMGTLVPLIGFISVGLGSAVLYLLRLALYSPDVSWDRKNNPEPWNKLGPTDQYKVTNLPYGKLQDFLGQKGGGWSQDWSRPTPHGGWLVSRP
uniref:NUA4L dehydrogenase n=1 Tax=Anser cygnoides TaxID=8845 RepID=A0A8B9DKI1_ANSCY